MNWFAKLKLNTVWYPDELHFLCAAGTILLAPNHRLAGFLVVVAWALWVELFYDPRYERLTPIPDLSDLRDIADYLAGGLAGLAVLALKDLILRLL